VKRPWLLALVAVNLVAIGVLVFAYPHLTIAPGPLMPAHAALATDCFACHAPLRSASAARCVACHAVPDIGRRTTKGLPIVRAAAPAKAAKAAFHQALTEPHCMACHSDHAGPKLTQRRRTLFTHALLQPATRDRCESCHVAPKTAIHKQANVGCAQCHKAEAWKPATFEHDKLFVLDRDHNASCATCHTVAEDYSRYTCYGCHEHTPAKVQREHEEEGIRNFDHCVECHRSAEGEPERRSGEGRKRD
jgi:hypothetical protein